MPDLLHPDRRGKQGTTCGRTKGGLLDEFLQEPGWRLNLLRLTRKVLPHSAPAATRFIFASMESWSIPRGGQAGAEDQLKRLDRIGRPLGNPSRRTRAITETVQRAKTTSVNLFKRDIATELWMELSCATAPIGDEQQRKRGISRRSLRAISTTEGLIAAHGYKKTHQSLLGVISQTRPPSAEGLTTAIKVLGHGSQQARHDERLWLNESKKNGGVVFL